MSHQVAVIGMGRFGISLACELYRIGHDVLAVDRYETLTQQMMGLVTYSVTGDSTSMQFLDEVGIRNFDTAVVAIGDIQASVLTTVLLKRTFEVPEVVARATNELHGKTLEAVGSDRVIYPEQETGLRTAHSLFQREVLEYMELNDTFGLSKVSVTTKMVGLTLEKAGLSTISSDVTGTTIIAINRGSIPILNPSKDEVIQTGDELILAGPEDTLEKFGN
tara:strand:+ start:23817 stop:24476 length:660 start_codon:yes stop_codon:yes gene_type:complete